VLPSSLLILDLVMAMGRLALQHLLSLLSRKILKKRMKVKTLRKTMKQTLTVIKTETVQEVSCEEVPRNILVPMCKLFPNLNFDD
jgi:hypothetical protein